jgi:hypothetical protein
VDYRWDKKKIIDYSLKESMRNINIIATEYQLLIFE